MPRQAFTPTDEQQRALRAFMTSDNLVLEAGAGTGKTSTLKLFGSATNDSGLYLAYNRQTADTARVSFPSNVECRTAHSLAFSAVGRNFRDRLNEKVKVWDAAKVLDIDHAISYGGHVLPVNMLTRLVMEMVGNFCNSADESIEITHAPYVSSLRGFDAAGQRFNYLPMLAADLLPLARHAWVDLQSPTGRLQFSHDHYLKMWQLTDPVLRTEFVLFDEAQDANPVIASILARQSDDLQRVYVSDRAQAIYGWRGAVDAMSSFADSAQVLQLSNSFRFGEQIALEANYWLEQLGLSLRLIGSNRDSRVCTLEQPDAVLCRTNAGTVEGLLDAQARGLRGFLVGDADSIKSFCRGVIELQTKGSSSHRDLLGFSTWSEVLRNASDEGGTLHVWCTILNNHTPQRVLDALAAMPASEQDADIVFSTAHRAKGREWDSVLISPDFAVTATAGDVEDPLSNEEKMLRYVAVTRAKYELDVGGLANSKDEESNG